MRPDWRALLARLGAAPAAPRQARRPTAADAARLGEELRQARLTLGLPVEALAERLRIRRPYLEALEEGRTADLPGDAYALGYVRLYATALGLDGDEMVRRYRDVSGLTRRPDLVFPAPVPERGVPAGAVVAVGLLLSLGAYVAWYDWTGNGERVVDAVPPVPARLEAQMAPQGGAASEGAGRTLPTGPREGGGASPPGPASMQAAVTPAPVAAAPAPAAPAPVAVEAPRLVIRAREEGAEGAWVQVREPNLRQPLLNRVLRPGESWAVPARAGLVLDTGKAENLEVLLDGQPVPALGNAVGVRRNIALDPGRLRSARQAGPVN